MASPRLLALAVLGLFVVLSHAQSVADCSAWSYRNLNGSYPTEYAVTNVFWLLTGDALLGSDYSLIRSPAPSSVVGPYIQIRDTDCSWNTSAVPFSWSCHFLVYSDASLAQQVGDVNLVSNDLAFSTDGSNAISGTAYATFIMDSTYAETIDPLYRRNFESKPNATYQILPGESRYWQNPVSNLSDPAYFQLVGREIVDTTNVSDPNATVYGSAFNLLVWTKCESSAVLPPPPPPPPPPTNETSAFDCDKFYVTQLNLDSGSYCSGQDCTINSLYISDQSAASNDTTSPRWRIAPGSMLGPFIRVVEDQCVWLPGSSFRCDFMLYKDANYVNSIGKGRMRSFDLAFVDMMDNGTASNVSRALNGSLEFIYSIDAPIARIAAGQASQSRMLWMDFGELFNVLPASEIQADNYGLKFGDAVNGTSEPTLYIVSSSDISTANASAARAAFAVRAVLVCADLGVAVENCTRFLVQDAERSDDLCDDNAFYMLNNPNQSGACAIQDATGPWIKLEQGDDCFWNKTSSNFACPIGIYLDRARTRLIGTGILSSNNLAFDALGVVTGDIFVQAAYDGKLIVLDMSSNSSDATYFANFVNRRSFLLPGLEPSKVFTENNYLYNGGDVRDGDLKIAVKAAYPIEGATDRYTVIHFAARLECPKIIPAIPPCDAFRMIALPHHSVNAPYELVPNVLYFPQDPRANLSAGDVNAFPPDSSFPLQELPSNASSIGLYFAIDSERGCVWRKSGEMQCWLWLYDDRLMFQPFASAALVSTDFKVEASGAAFGNFLLSTFPIEGVPMKEMMWNFNNISNLAISVPRLELLNNTSRPEALVSRFSVFPILDKNADDSVFPNMYLSFIGEGLLPADRVTVPQNDSARFWINFRAIASCLAPPVPDCGVLAIDAAQMFADNYFYLIDADIVLMDSPDRDNMIRAPNREALVGPWFQFDSLKGCDWNVNKTLNCEAWLYKSGLFKDSDRIGRAMISSPGLMRMGADVSGSIVVTKDFTAPYVTTLVEGDAPDVGFSDRNFMPFLNKSYSVPVNANVSVDGELVANRVIRLSNVTNVNDSNLLLSFIAYDADMPSEPSAVHLRALLSCADVNGTVNGTCQRYSLMNWMADTAAPASLSWNYLYVPRIFLGDFFAGASRDLSVLRGHPAGPWISLKMGDDCFWIPSSGELSCGFEIFGSADRLDMIGEGRLRSNALFWRQDAVDSVDGSIWLTTTYPNSVIVLPFAVNDSRVQNYVDSNATTYTIMVPSADRSGLVSKLHYGRVLEKANATANYSTSVFDPDTALIDLYLWGAQSNDSITNATQYARALSLHSRVMCGESNELYRCGRFYIRAANNSVERLFGLLPRSLDFNAFYSLVNSTSLPYNLTVPDIRNFTLPEADWWRTFFYNTSLPDRYRLPYWPFNFNISLPTWPYPANFPLPAFPIPGIDYFNPAWRNLGNITLPGNVTIPNIPGLPGIPNIPGLPSNPNGSVNLPDISIPDEINIPGLPTIPIPDINVNLTDPQLPSVDDITRSLFPYIVDGQVRWDLLPVGPIFQLQEGEDCYWEPEAGNFNCPITLFGDTGLSIPIGSGLLSADGAFGLLNDTLNSIGGVLNVTFKYDLDMPVGTPEQIRRLFQNQDNVQYVFLPPTIANFSSDLQPVLNRVIDWRNTTSSVGFNLTGDVTRDINDLYVTGIGYAPFLQSGLNTNWQLVCDIIGTVPV